MKRSGNKGLMIIIMISMIVISSLVMGVSQINAKVTKINKVFEVGAYNDGLSIRRDLQTRIECSKNLVTLAKMYMSASEQAIKDVEDLIHKLEKEESKAELYKLNSELQQKIEVLWNEINKYDISDKHLDSGKEQMSRIKNAQNTISYDPYNTEVAEFEKETSGLIASIMKIFTKKVEYFR